MHWDWGFHELVVIRWHILQLLDSSLDVQPLAPHLTSHYMANPTYTGLVIISLVNVYKKMNEKPSWGGSWKFCSGWRIPLLTTAHLLKTFTIQYQLRSYCINSHCPSEEAAFLKLPFPASVPHHKRNTFHHQFSIIQEAISQPFVLIARSGSQQNSPILHILDLYKRYRICI